MNEGPQRVMSERSHQRCDPFCVCASYVLRRLPFAGACEHI